MDAAHLSKCSEHVGIILDNEQFQASNFWEGYKLYCFAHYSHCDMSKALFEDSKMCQVVCEWQSISEVARGAQFDAIVREAWVMMEEYVSVRHGKDCTNLRALMEEFDDAEELSKSKNGSLLLQLIEDDEHATEHLYRQSQPVHFETDIFEEVRARLNQVQVNLANLSPQSRSVGHRTR